MSRRIFPRRPYQHAQTANRVHVLHALRTGVTIDLPVPIEMIIERTYGLEILWDDIPEEPGEIILGALSPRDRQIVLNLRYESLFDRYMGPERFTLAHELAHWIYDADDPDQLTLDFAEKPEKVYCLPPDSPELTETQRIREVNANKLAAHLLLPEDLVHRKVAAGALDNFSDTAAKWGVSRTMLEIRLQELRLIDRQEPA